MPSREAMVLAELEQLEADQINLGLYNTSVTSERIYQSLGSTFSSSEEIRKILHYWVQEGEVIEWRPDSFRSRIAETVRSLRLLRRRFWENQAITDARLLVQDVRVAFRQRKRPNRNAIPLSQALPKQLPQELRNAFQDAMHPIQTLSAFQARALSGVFDAGIKGNPENKSFIIAGDTGAGKTEAFLFPILLTIAGETAHQRALAGVRAVLVYPRIRLARNQLARILKYTSRFISHGGRQITVGIQNGSVPADSTKLRSSWREVAPNIFQVDLIETCIECEQGQYEVVIDEQVDTGCPILTCNHCHHQISNLHITQRALEVNAPHLLIITDVSLSHWLSREKYSHLWGLWSGSVRTLPPKFLVLDEVHLHEQIKGAHVARLVKRFQARVRFAWKGWREAFDPIIIGVSATLRDETRFLAKLLDVDYDSSPDIQRRLICIKPSEAELTLTEGRERYIFLYPDTSLDSQTNSRVDDQSAAIQIVMSAMHNLKVTEEWKGLAFFDSINDLRQFQYNYENNAPGRQDREQGANNRELWRIRTDRIRRDGRTQPTNCPSDCASLATNLELHTCPHFVEGDCWVFAKLHGWNRPLKVASSVYAGSTASQLDRSHLIPTSPSLEVGYDDENIQLIYQHKAPRSTASFIQRRGRAGRDPDDSPVIVTLLWPYKTDDAFYFFYPESLYSPLFDDIPLNAGNFNVQRTHSVLAFFDLLACLRRQDREGLGHKKNIIDFTNPGDAWITPNTDVLLSFKHDKQAKRIHLKTTNSRRPEFDLKGGQLDHVEITSNQLRIKGWLAIKMELTRYVLRETWEEIHSVFEEYLILGNIITDDFASWRGYPFVTPFGGSTPRVVGQFGSTDWHIVREKEKYNLVASFKHIDWMLQGSDDVTTLDVQIPNPRYVQGGDEDYWLRTDVTFGRTELLPGNVSYRLRQDEFIHWTRIPKDGESTFLYPQRTITNDDGTTRRENDPAHLPKLTDITSKADSVFGVPRHLDVAFPGLPLMSIERLRVQEFGRPGEEFGEWYFDPQTRHAYRPQNILGQNGLQISRRSSTHADSVIIPYFVAQRTPTHLAFDTPLSDLFGEIAGYLEEGNAMLGYTRVFYEMQVDVRLRNTSSQPQPAMRRKFYPPPELMEFEGDIPKPVLVGYNVETHGIAFQVNPTILVKAVEAILTDEVLRLDLRRKFAVYSLAQRAHELDRPFLKTLVDDGFVLVDYWLQQIYIEQSAQPRLLSLATDRQSLINYYFSNLIVTAEDTTSFQDRLTSSLVQFVNDALLLAFQDMEAFRAYLISVLLHSLASLLKRIVAQLGGVSTNDLVAYADLPLMDHVDRTIDPRILIMDTVSGGSGGVAQAFERLNLRNQAGSLWWLLQRDLGTCPIADAEGLTQAFWNCASSDQIEELQALQRMDAEAARDRLDELLIECNLGRPTENARLGLGRKLFANNIMVGGESINPASVAREMALAHDWHNGHTIGSLPKITIVRRIAESNDLTNFPETNKMRLALNRHGASGSNYELAVQLNSIHSDGCNDGCPVCLGMHSDMEHYYLVNLMNSRKALKKLREILAEGNSVGASLVELSSELLRDGMASVSSTPGRLGNQLDEELGLGVVEHVDDTGQIISTSVVAIDNNSLREFIVDGDWERRWNKPELKPYETPGGVKVRSRAEYIIATTLEHNEIQFEYEPKLPYRHGNRTLFIHPDFYLYEHDLYLEYWGMDKTEKAYVESREFKEKIYSDLAQRRKLRVLHLEADDIKYSEFWEKIRREIQT